jgi:hypothetical protein
MLFGALGTRANHNFLRRRMRLTARTDPMILEAVLVTKTISRRSDIRIVSGSVSCDSAGILRWDSFARE